MIRSLGTERDSFFAETSSGCESEDGGDNDNDEFDIDNNPQLAGLTAVHHCSGGNIPL